MSGKEFPNNWQEIHDTPSEAFLDMPYEHFMDLTMMWSIPSSHCCIMRCENKDTGKIKEYAYQRQHAAVKKLQELTQDDSNEIVIVDDDQIAIVKKQPPLLHPFNDDDFFR